MVGDFAVRHFCGGFLYGKKAASGNALKGIMALNQLN